MVPPLGWLCLLLCLPAASATGAGQHAGLPRPLGYCSDVLNKLSAEDVTGLRTRYGARLVLMRRALDPVLADARTGWVGQLHGPLNKRAAVCTVGWRGEGGGGTFVDCAPPVAHLPQHPHSAALRHKPRSCSAPPSRLQRVRQLRYEESCRAWAAADGKPPPPPAPAGAATLQQARQHPQRQQPQPPLCVYSRRSNVAKTPQMSV